MRIVIVKQENCGQKFLFQAPDEKCLKASDLVKVRTKKGETIGTCLCDSSDTEVGSPTLDAICAAFGTKEITASVIGRYDFDAFPEIKASKTRMNSEWITTNHVTQSTPHGIWSYLDKCVKRGDALNVASVGDKISFKMKDGKDVTVIVADITPERIAFIFDKVYWYSQIDTDNSTTEGYQSKDKESLWNLIMIKPLLQRNTNL